MLVVEVPHDLIPSTMPNVQTPKEEADQVASEEGSPFQTDAANSESSSSPKWSKITNDTDDDVKSIRLDISFKSPTHTGLQTTGLVKDLTERFPAVTPLALVLKQFLADRSLDQSYSGGLSPYCLNYGSLLMDFLYFFGNVFDPRQIRISVQGSGVYLNRERGCSIDPLCIDDPLFLTNNVGRNCFRIHQCIKAFADAYAMLENEFTCLPCGDETDAKPNFSSFSIMALELDVSVSFRKFLFELKKQISSSMKLSNTSDNYVAFKVKTTNPKKYCVRPNTGVVLPHSACEVKVMMQAQKEAPADMQCRDKFLLQSVVVSPGVTAKDITPEMFNKDSGNQVDECKLRVIYVPPRQPTSPVQEGSEEGSSPRASVSENGTVNQTSDFNFMSKAYAEPQESTSEVKALISKLTEEKRSAIQQNNKLQQELELLRRQGNKSQGGIPFMYVIIVGLIGILLGYLLKRT
ncbi:hypothetical protein RD792_004292 [Penstemon davidsonii]|uniref:MSP domain-containing protein n=1 Tax=Penstemon davidsonii TaxID=160366 RepID=A0ABR0DIE2_9LAMI|nr:hypothetical protein RD792_004292 [Penstemon davidsonii]